jgi:nitroreductase
MVYIINNQFSRRDERHFARYLFMLAARTVGIDCRPISGFNNTSLDKDFFPNSKTKSIFICALEQGGKSKIYPLNPRLCFNEVCKII